MGDRIQLRRGTTEEWVFANPILQAGEPGYETSTQKVKLGNGVDRWSELLYLEADADSVSWSAVTDKPSVFPPDTTSLATVAISGNYEDLVGIPSEFVPSSHKASHAAGGSDALAPSDIGAAPAASPTFTDGATFSTSSLVEVSSATGRAAPVPTEIRLSTTSAGSDWSTTDAWGRLGFHSADTSGNGPATQAAVDAVSTNTAGSLSNLVFKLWNGVSLATRGTLTANGLDIPGVITVSATPGSAGSYLPSVCFENDANTGFGSLSSDTASIFTGGTERLRVDSSGRVSIGTTSPSSLLDINSDKIRLRTAKTPASASDTGNAGDICWDANYVYVCVATNTWKRSALSTW